jgi:exonuclease III
VSQLSTNLGSLTSQPYRLPRPVKGKALKKKKKKKRIISEIKRVEYISDWMSYLEVIVLNVHAPTEDKIDYVKDSFYEELEHVFDKFPKYHMKILLGDFNVKVGREDIFRPTIGNESYTKLVMIMELH